MMIIRMLKNSMKMLLKCFEDKNKDISNIIRAYNQLLKTQEDQPDNFLHNQNLINLGNQIVEENSIFAGYNKYEKEIRDISNKKELKDIDDIIKKLIKNNEENEKNALKKLDEEYYIILEKYYKDDEFRLKLRGAKNENKYPKLGDEGFKLISQIRFKDLIEINLSNNNISNISYLNNMLLPHLEILNFSDNKIIDIAPVANLVSKNLSEIYLQNNKIIDITPFEKAKFSIQSLEILRLDGNVFNISDKNEQENQANQKLISIFGNKVIVKKSRWEYFNKKYNCTVDEEDEKLDLSSKRKSSIIIDLFPLVTSSNNIKILIMDNNKITDANLLTKMWLYNLTFLDLSLNLITNINFVKNLAVKCKDLKILYLHDNKINDLIPLIKYKDNKNYLIFENLETLTLKNNNLNLNDSVTKEILKTLTEEEKLTLDYKKSEITKINNNDSEEKLENEQERKKHGGEFGAAQNAMNNQIDIK